MIGLFKVSSHLSSRLAVDVETFELIVSVNIRRLPLVLNTNKKKLLIFARYSQRL